MADRWIEPSAQQEALSALAQADLVETINRLIREGMDPRIVLAALGASAADLITSVFGASGVEPWFTRQAEMIRFLHRPQA